MKQAELQKQMSPSQAKYYAELTSINVKRSIERKLLEGQWVNKAPLGYKNVRINGVADIEVDLERLPFVVSAFNLRLAGLKYWEIAAQLAGKGFRDPQGNCVSSFRIRRMLNSPFYYGVMEYNGKTYQHRYEAIVSRRLFAKCLEVSNKGSKR
jgi:hypothetical protein